MIPAGGAVSATLPMLRAVDQDGYALDETLQTRRNDAFQVFHSPVRQ